MHDAADAGPEPDAPRDVTLPAPAMPVHPAAAPARAEPTPTGPLARTRAALAQLEERPLVEHPEVYEGVHAELRSALASIDDA